MVDRYDNFYGSGWSFPVSFSVATYQLNLSESEENINQSIDLILTTKNGERCFEPGFGSNLKEFFFRQMDETLKGEMIEAVKTALLDNEPRITVTGVDVEFADLQAGLINIIIRYVFNQANTRHNYVFPFHIKEGTNL